MALGKIRWRYDLASGAPIFANGAATAAFSMMIQSGLAGAARTNSNSPTNQTSSPQASATQGQLSGMAKALSVVGDVIGKIWNLPNTILGLVYGGIGHVAGWIMGTNPYITFGNNAIQFHNNPLMSSAMTMGNVIVYGPRISPTDSNVHFQNSPVGHTVGREEYRHTLQGQILGPLYFPAHAVGGMSSFMRSPNPGLLHPVDPWHSNNFMETGPMQDRTF